jgi:outer membrane biosynthesis protein TonB
LRNSGCGSWINLKRDELKGLGQAAEISIKGGGIDERFALPGMAAVLKALDACNQDLREHWNVTEATAAKITKEASPLKPLGSYVSNGDYPTQASRENASGKTGFIMMIGETGKIEDCMVEETSGIASLDAMACGIFLERAKFTPALDAAGKPIRSVCMTSVTWILPD